MKMVNYILGILAIFAISCDSDIATDDYSATPQQISVTTNLNMTSRATVDFNTEDNFYLYIDQAGGLYDYFAQMKYENGSWASYDANSDEPVEMMLVDEYSEISFVAIFCADTELTAESFLTTTPYDCSGADMLYAKSGFNGSTISNEAVMSLEFSHILSKLDVSVAVNDPSLGKIISVSIDGFLDSFDMNANVGSSSIIATGEEVTLTSDEESTTHSFIIVPQSVDGFIVTVVLDSGSYSIRYNSEVQFESGEPYSIALELGELTPIEITGITSGSWSAGDNYLFEVTQD